MIKTFTKWHLQSKIPTHLFNDSNCRGYRVENEVCSMAGLEERCLGANIWRQFLLINMAGLFPDT